MTSRDPVDDVPRRFLRRRVRDRWTAVRRAVLRRRRLLAALCAAGATAAAVRVVAPPPPDTVLMPVAARGLPAGAVVGAEDLRLAEVPAQAVPPSLVDDPVGSTLAAPVGEGEPVTDVRLVGPDLTAAAPGTTAVPVRFSDAAQAALLDVGDRVDVLATDPQERTTTEIATDVVVLAIPPAVDDGGALAGRVVVLGVPATDVPRVTTAAATAFVTYAWRTR